MAIKLLNPDGSLPALEGWGGSTFNLAQRTLPVNGTYTIVIDPYDHYVGSFSISVTNP